MSLSHLAVVLILASTYSLAADPNARPVSSEVNSSLESIRLVPWFTGTHHTVSESPSEPAVESWAEPVTPGSYNCLKLRTYKVKRQESFSEGEASLRAYSTCKWVLNYRLRSTVETQTLPVSPQ